MTAARGASLALSHRVRSSAASLTARLLAVAAMASLLFSAGCATTTVETTGSPLAEPLCRTDAATVDTLVFWAPRWRPDQKEPALREAAALRGIEDFLSRTSCLAVLGLHRLPSDGEVPSDGELLRVAASSPGRADRVVLVVVRELGPRLAIGLPMIVEGGTEVLVEVRVLDARRSASLGSVRTLRRHGGPFVVEGVETLDQDMSAALRAALMPNAVPE